MRLDLTYTTPVEHHNPMEPHATIALWDGDRLTVYSATQGIDASQHTLVGAVRDRPEQSPRDLPVCRRRRSAARA